MSWLFYGVIDHRSFSLRRCCYRQGHHMKNMNYHELMAIQEERNRNFRRINFAVSLGAVILFITSMVFLTASILSVTSP
jgi:hypothetical protein